MPDFEAGVTEVVEPAGVVPDENGKVLGGLQRPKAIRLWTRVGAWGIIIGVTVPILNLSIMGSVALSLIGGSGMIVGGLGAIGLGLTLLAERGARPAWRVSGLALVPFGWSAVVLGASSFAAIRGFILPWGWFPGGLKGAFVAFLTIGLVLSVLLGLDMVRLATRRFRDSQAR